MGFFGTIKNTLTGTKSVSLDARLGNVLITGTSKTGKDAIIRSYAIDSVNNNMGLIVFRDQRAGISTYPSISSSNRLIYEVDGTDNSASEQIDVFYGLNDKEICDRIIKMFDLLNELEKSKKMNYTNYLRLLRSLAKRAGKTVKLDNLIDFPIEEIEALNMRYATSSEQMQNDRFLNSIRADIIGLESYFSAFSQNVAGYVLSGNRSIERVFCSKPIIEISLDFTSRAEESVIILSAILEALNRVNLTVMNKAGVNVIVDGAPNEVLYQSGLQNIMRNNNGNNVLFTVQDISNLLEQSNEWIDYIDSCFFFRQTSNKNKEFCSEFFGTYEKKKEQVTQGVSKPSWWDRLSGTGSTSKQNSTTVSYEKERVYLPEVFSALPDNQAIFYSKRRNEHTRLTIY